MLVLTFLFVVFLQERQVWSVNFLMLLLVMENRTLNRSGSKSQSSRLGKRVTIIREQAAAVLWLSAAIFESQPLVRERLSLISRQSFDLQQRSLCEVRVLLAYKVSFYHGPEGCIVG